MLTQQSVDRPENKQRIGSTVKIKLPHFLKSFSHWSTKIRNVFP